MLWGCCGVSQAAFIQAASILKARTYCIQPPQWASDPGQVRCKPGNGTGKHGCTGNGNGNGTASRGQCSLLVSGLGLGHLGQYQGQ